MLSLIEYRSSVYVRMQYKYYIGNYLRTRGLSPACVASNLLRFSGGSGGGQGLEGLGFVSFFYHNRKVVGFLVDRRRYIVRGLHGVSAGINYSFIYAILLEI